MQRAEKAQTVEKVYEIGNFLATSPPNNTISSDRQGVKISLVFFVGWYLYLHSAPYKLIRISIGCTWRTAPHSYAGICHRSSGGHISQQTHSDHHHTITHHHPLCYIIIQSPLLCNICIIRSFSLLFLVRLFNMIPWTWLVRPKFYLSCGEKTKLAEAGKDKQEKPSSGRERQSKFLLCRGLHKTF